MVPLSFLVEHSRRILICIATSFQCEHVFLVIERCLRGMVMVYKGSLLVHIRLKSRMLHQDLLISPRNIS